MDIKGIKESFDNKMEALKREIGALYFAYRHKDTPLYAKVVVAIVVGYALSPIDLIPDFIPILGYLDDVILLPLGIALAIKLVPVSVMEASRIKAKAYFNKKNSKNWVAAGLIIIVWLLLLAFVLHTILR